MFALYELENADFKDLRVNITSNFNYLNKGLFFVMMKSQQCVHCAKFYPIFERLAIKYNDDSTFFATLDAKEDIAAKIAQDRKIAGVPTFLVFKNGAIVHSFTSDYNKPNDLENQLKDLIQNHGRQ